MSIDISVNFSFRSGLGNIPFAKIIEQFSFLVLESSRILGQHYEWYETGFSKKQALSHVAFENTKISESTFLKWEKRYKKDLPLFVESIWDGKGDYSSSINYRKMFFDQTNRANVELHLVSRDEQVDVGKFISLLSNIARHFECSYVNADSNGYRFFDRNVFPDRLSVGWMIFIPSVVLPELIPSAARVAPVVKDGKQIGTIIISTEEIFDGNKKEHIEKSNELEIRLLDLGLLPLITEL